MNKLGKLEKVNLRDIWANEEYDFSVWLSKEENLKELSNTIGIDIVLEERESAVGKYIEENIKNLKFKWERLDNKKASRIKAIKKCDVTNQEEWEDCIK